MKEVNIILFAKDGFHIIANMADMMMLHSICRILGLKIEKNWLPNAFFYRSPLLSRDFHNMKVTYAKTNRSVNQKGD